jgi:hypothetical protein
VEHSEAHITEEILGAIAAAVAKIILGMLTDKTKLPTSDAAKTAKEAADKAVALINEKHNGAPSQ